jgi:uncharacterized protein YciI
MGLWLRMVLVTGLPEEVSPLFEAHRDHLRALRGAGKLRVAGELGRGDGFFDLFEAVDRHDAEAVTRESPLVEAGQATWMLREWTEVELD